MSNNKKIFYFIKSALFKVNTKIQKIVYNTKGSSYKTKTLFLFLSSPLRPSLILSLFFSTVFTSAKKNFFDPHHRRFKRQWYDKSSSIRYTHVSKKYVYLKKKRVTFDRFENAHNVLSKCQIQTDKTVKQLQYNSNMNSPIIYIAT